MVGANSLSAAWGTSFYVPQTVSSCQVSDVTSAPSNPLHRTSSIKLNFGGPVLVDDMAGAVTVGTTEQHVSNPDVVYYRNNKAASDDQFMMIVEPRSTGSDGELEVAGVFLVSGLDGFGTERNLHG